MIVYYRFCLNIKEEVSIKEQNHCQPSSKTSLLVPIDAVYCDAEFQYRVKLVGHIKRMTRKFGLRSDTHQEKTQMLVNSSLVSVKRTRYE